MSEHTESLQMPSADTSARARWGLWATLGFSVLIAAAFLLIQFLAVTGVVAIMRRVHPGAAPLTDEVQVNGLLLSLSTLLAAPACIGLILLFVRLRRGAPVRDYLAWRPVSPVAAAGWIVLGAALMIASELLTSAAGKPSVPDFMLEAYQSAGFVPLFVLAIVVAAPLFEELFFRGFLFEGIRGSRLGATGAVLLTSLLWSVVHTQYDLFDVLIVFLCGLMLGLARLRSGSTRLTFLLHALWNLAATIEVAFELRGP